MVLLVSMVVKPFIHLLIVEHLYALVHLVKLVSMLLSVVVDPVVLDQKIPTLVVVAVVPVHIEQVQYRCLVELII